MSAVQFLTPVGRFVQGDVFEAQTKDQQGNPLTVKTGPNAGQPTQRYFMAVAFAKNDAAFGPFYQQIFDTARAAFPQHFNAQGKCTHPKFAFKVMDGDGVDDNGKQNNQKEGFAGHWVVKFGSSFAPKAFNKGHYQPHEQVTDKNAIRRGYFVRIAGTIEGNNNAQKPGVYVNLNMVELAGYGDEIVSGPQADAVFGGAPTAGVMPAGFRPTPAGGSPALPGGPAAPVGALPGPAALPPGPAASMPAPAVQITPNPAFLQAPVVAPAVPAAMPMAAAPAQAIPVAPARSMTAKAGGYTRDQMIGAGWTDDALIAQGYMTA